MTDRVVTITFLVIMFETLRQPLDQLYVMWRDEQSAHKIQ